MAENAEREQEVSSRSPTPTSPKSGTKHKCVESPRWDYLTNLPAPVEQRPKRDKTTYELVERPVAKGPIFKLKGYNAVEEVDKWKHEQYKVRARQRSARRRKQEEEQRLSREAARARRRSSDMDDDSEGDDENQEGHPRTRTFAWYSRVVKAVCRLSLDMKKLSVKRTQQTGLAQMYYINVSGAPPEDEANLALFFDKDLYSRKRALHKVPLWAQAVMVKKPEERTPREVRRLHKLLCNMRSFKEKFTESMRLKMCEVVRYTKCDQGRIVLRQGQAGHDFYFIFSGSVFIQIDVPDRVTGKIVTQTENIIRNGESFGEIALLGDGTRSATVICREPTELLQIDKETFLEVCPDVFTAELDKKIEFAKKFEVFQGWEEDPIKQLCFLSQVLYIPHGRLIESDWTRSNFVYFVIKGRISLLLEFDVSRVSQGDDDVRLEGMMGRRMDVHAMIDRDQFKNPKRLACVGHLTEGDSSELGVLALEPPPHMAPARMLSEGVQVLRVAIRAFQRLGPKRRVEEYLRKDYESKVLPSGTKLCRRWLRDLHWRSFKRRLLTSRLLELSGRALAHVPATCKGSSGWARWPGFDPQAPSKTARLSLRWERSQTDPFLVVDPEAPELLPRFKVEEVQKARERAAKERRRPTGPEIVVDTGVPRTVFQNERTLTLKPSPGSSKLHVSRSVSSFT